MNLSVIIVTYNSSAHIRACLDSLQQYLQGADFEVIVIDNASVDGTADVVATEYSWVQLIRNTENRGFGAANNQGAAVATGAVLALINDDTVQTHNALEQAAKRVSTEEDIGVLGTHLLYEDGRHQDSVRRYPGFADQALILTKLHRLFPNAAPLTRYLANDTDYTCEQEVEQLMGACMILRKSVFEAANGFDEQFFIWFEEVDLQKRIREEQGLQIMYTPALEMIHIKSAAFGREKSTTNQRRFNRSMRQYFKKHASSSTTAAIILLQPLALLLAVGVQTLGMRTRKRS